MSSMFAERSSSSCFMRAASLSRTLSNPGGKPVLTAAASNSGVPSAATVTYTLGLIACVLLLVQTVHDRTSAGPALGKRRAWRDLESLSRDRHFEAMLATKDQEIDTLKQQLGRLMAGDSIKEVNMQSQEAIIRVLQDKAQQEREARAKAQFALSERVEALEGCVRQRKALEEEVHQCQHDVAAFMRAGSAGFAGAVRQ